MAKRTQKERLLDRLRLGALCSMEPLGWDVPITRVAARIYDLKQDGVEIDVRKTCPEHLSGKAPHAYYRLDSTPIF